MAKSSRKPRSRKAVVRPEKPYPEFPLYAHPNGRWAKRIKGELKYFGRWGRVRQGKMTRLDGDGWVEALEIYKAQVDDLQAGKKPRGKDADGLTVKPLCDRFYTAKLRAVEAGELSKRSLAEYDATCARLVKTFGRNRRVDDLDADEFDSLRADLAKQYGPVRLGNEIGRVKTIFKFALKHLQVRTQEGLD